MMANESAYLEAFDESIYFGIFSLIVYLDPTKTPLFDKNKSLSKNSTLRSSKSGTETKKGLVKFKLM
jgi:hypothetical protein